MIALFLVFGKEPLHIFLAVKSHLSPSVLIGKQEKSSEDQYWPSKVFSLALVIMGNMGEKYAPRIHHVILCSTLYYKSKQVRESEFTPFVVQRLGRTWKTRRGDFYRTRYHTHKCRRLRACTNVIFLWQQQTFTQSCYMFCKNFSCLLPSRLIKLI